MIERVRMMVLRCLCERCGRRWHVLPPAEPGRCCPGCKSPYWQIPRGRLTKGRPEEEEPS